ncbi:MAG TPA: hypothetical protein VGK73_23010 [Polyangiaceae bacterium]
MRNDRLLPEALGRDGAPGAEPSVLERPPPGLARGSQAVPAALVLGVALALVLATAAYYLVRWRRARRR